MTSSFSNLVDNLAEGIHKIKVKDRNCFFFSFFSFFLSSFFFFFFFEFESANNNLMNHKFLSCNKNNSKKIDKNL